MTPKDFIDKLENVQKDVEEIKKFLSQNPTPIPSKYFSTGIPDFKLDYTLEDLYREFGRKKSLAHRLKTALQKRNINTLEEFLSLKPGELLDLENVGYDTLLRTKKALNRMGLTW